MKKLIFLLIPIFLLSACKTYVPFTNKLKTDNNWNESELKQIQFYLSNTITLHRQLGNSETKIESGIIKTVDGKKVEEVIIKKGTPGVVSNLVDKTKMTVSFEIDDNHFLTFGSYQNRAGRYYLMLKDYKKDRWSKVTYVQKEFFISPESLQAFLQVDMKRIKKEERNQRVAGGRKL
jgi:acid phosphatase class B